MARLINQDRVREHRAQIKQLDRLTNRFSGQIYIILSDAMEEMVRFWAQTKEVALPRGFYSKMEGAYKAMVIDSVETFAGRIYDQGKSAGLDLERKESFPEMVLRWALEYVYSELIRQRITAVTETTRSQIIALIAKGYEEGLPIEEIVRMIMGSIPELSRFRARMIARTETHGASNYGAQRAAIQTGLPMKREWFAAEDARTRPSHSKADGQTVGMTEKFIVGSSALLFPGDPEGPAHEVINCRCTVGYIVDRSRLFG